VTQLVCEMAKFISGNVGKIRMVEKDVLERIRGIVTSEAKLEL